MRDPLDMRRIYLDSNASARMRPSARGVFDRLAEAQNPSSVHHSGRAARALLRSARREILTLLGFPELRRTEVLIFTSGGTEACNLLVTGFLGDSVQLHRCPGHIVSSAIEHPSVLEPLRELGSLGWQVELIRPGRAGIVDEDAFLASVRPDTALACLMAANNETGAVQPIAQVARRLRSSGFTGPIVCDFVQALGKGQVSGRELFEAGVDALAISSHKLGAPAGSGAVVLNRNDSAVCRSFRPLLRGGFQEDGFRAGTENLHGAVAFGAAARELSLEETELVPRLSALRNHLWEEIRPLECAERIGPVRPEQLLPNTLMVRFRGLRADDLVVALDIAGVMVSAGSACASGKQAVSDVLTAMGYPEDEAREAIRFSLDWASSQEDIVEAARRIRETVRRSEAVPSSSESNPGGQTAGAAVRP